jgi:hypothetical protein
MNQKPTQSIRTANNRFLHRIMQATRRSNDLLCKLGAAMQQTIPAGGTHVETALQAVPMSADAPQKIANANPDRLELWICNSGDRNLMIAPSANMDANRYSAVITPDDTLRIQINESRIYSSAIYGIWASGASSESTAMITEYFPVPDAEQEVPKGQVRRETADSEKAKGTNSES